MSYIGSKINVTTISENQYDGILTAINAKEATLELQMVRLVASKGKHITDGSYYDYVVFKSDDIKDLQLYTETAASKPVQKEYSDPAIVSAKPSNPPEKHGKAATREKGIQFGAVGSTYAPSAMEHQAPKERPSVVVNSETIKSSPTSFAAAAAAAAAAPTFSPGHSAYTNTNNNNSMPKPTQKVRSYSTVTKQTTQKEIPVDQLQRERDQQESQRRSAPKGPFVPSKDYDFQRANQNFDKEQIAAEVAPVLSSDGPYYNKTSSFFDSISSELNSQEDGHLRTERAWNMETFGEPYVRGSSRGSSRGRGGSGHRYQRGGRGTMHHNATGSFN